MIIPNETLWPAVLAIVVGLSVIAWARSHLKLSRRMRALMASSSYVLFQIRPAQVGLLEADLADHGWRLTLTAKAHPKASVYRFEKGNADATSLDQILTDVEEALPRTTGRPAFNRVPIKIKGYG